LLDRHSNVLRTSENRADRNALGRLTTAGFSLALIAWALLSIVWKFRVARLEAYEGALDLLFLVGAAAGALGWSSARWGIRRVRGALLRAGVGLVAAALTLIPLELAARFAYRDVHSSADGTDYFGQRRRAGGPQQSINSLGFRDKEIPPKTGERYRIAVVGDSFAWGQGIEERERFSNLLGQYLGASYEVLNFGIPGNNLPEHLAVLERALGVAPDFVLLQLYVNDFEMPDMQRPDASPLIPWPPLEEPLHRSSVVYDMANQAWQQFEVAIGATESYPHYMERNLADPNAPYARQAFGMLRQFIERARGAGAGVGTVFFPDPGLSTTNYPFAYLHERVARTCEEERIPCLDLRAPFAAAFRNPRQMWLSRFDQHPNARANEKAAQLIMSRFADVWRR
jgi:lysophospholipase L1-like esterase